MIWKLIVGLGLSAFFLWLALRSAEIDQVWAAVRSADYVWMIPMLLFTLVSFFIRALRWRYLLTTVGRIAIGPLVRATFIGFMGNNVLPARLGEFMRVYAIGDSAGVSRSAALASIVIERLLDVAVLLLLFAVVLMTGRLPEEVHHWGRYLLLGFVPVLALVVLFFAHSERFIDFIRRFSPDRFRDRLIYIAQNFRNGLGVLREGKVLAIAFLLSLPMWGALVLTVSCAFVALDLHLPVDAGAITLVIMAIGTMIPSAPGFIGTLQYAGTLALRLYDVDPSAAFSVTLLYHAIQWFPITLIGLVFFWQQHMSIRAVRGLDGGDKEPIEE